MLSLLAYVTFAANEYYSIDRADGEEDEYLEEHDYTTFVPSHVEPYLIMELSQDHDIDELHRVLSDSFRRSERNPDDGSVVTRLDQGHEIQGKGKKFTTEHKLVLDLEQAEYLAENLENKAKAKFFGDIVAPIYRNVLENARKGKKDELQMYEFTEKDIQLGIQDVYNKALHITDFDELLDEDELQPVSLLSDSLYDKQEEIEREYNEKSVVVVDDVLTPRALERIRQLLLESTVWYETKSPVDTGVYCGAYLNDGLHDRILLALAFELRAALPEIMENHPLSYLWGYKYESTNQGIKTHTDFAGKCCCTRTCVARCRYDDAHLPILATSCQY